MIKKPDLRQRVLSAVRVGRYALLLGAGFSNGAHSRDGRPLPLGRELADELADAFKRPRGHPLSRLWGSLPTPAREQYLQSRFRDCAAPPSLRKLSQFVWRAIYNLNVDDVVETVYDDAARKQDLELATHATPFSTPESIATIRCIHLHGSVLRPADGYIFSTSEYAESTVRHRAWGPALADDLAATPFIVIGCSLDEYDLEHHIHRRGQIDAASQPVPSLFVTNTPDEVTRAIAKRHGMLTVEGAAEQFLEWLYTQIPDAPSATELLVPRVPGGMYSTAPPDPDLRVFTRQFLYIASDELPVPLEHHNFLAGHEPQWNDFSSNNDVVRADVALLVDGVQSDLAKPAPLLSVRLVHGPPGSGKTSLLMRTALELSRLQVPTFFFLGDERLAPLPADSCLQHLSREPVIFVDSIADHADQVLQLARRLHERKGKLVLIGADRNAEARRARIALGEVRPELIELSRLSRDEATDLVHRMRANGLLGRTARFQDRDLVARATGRDLLVAVCELAGDRRRFDALATSIWTRVTDAEIRRVFARIAVAHSFNYSLKFAVAQKGTTATIGAIMREIAGGSLSGVVFREGLNGEYLRTSHRVLSERLLAAAIPIDDRFDAFVGLAQAIEPYVTRETIRRRTQEARLTARLLDYEPHVKAHLGTRARDFYASIREGWKWNSRYWEQLALLELDDGNLEVATTHARHAVGIEAHPLTFTTLGNVLIRASERAAPVEAGRRLFEEGLDALRRAMQMRREVYLSRDEHAHHVAISGAIRFFRRWREPIDEATSDWIYELIEEAKRGLRGAIDWRALESQWSELPRRGRARSRT